MNNSSASSVSSSSVYSCGYSASSPMSSPACAVSSSSCCAEMGVMSRCPWFATGASRESLSSVAGRMMFCIFPVVFGFGADTTRDRDSFSTDRSGCFVVTVLWLVLNSLTMNGLSATGASLCRVYFSFLRSRWGYTWCSGRIVLLSLRRRLS